jgi:hypothetical protein
MEETSLFVLLIEHRAISISVNSRIADDSSRAVMRSQWPFVANLAPALHS